MGVPGGYRLYIAILGDNLSQLLLSVETQAVGIGHAGLKGRVVQKNHSRLLRGFCQPCIQPSQTLCIYKPPVAADSQGIQDNNPYRSILDYILYILAAAVQQGVIAEN